MVLFIIKYWIIMKIAHISDLHLNTFYKNSNLSSINYIIKYALKQGFDHLAITGDLVDNAAKEDFEILRKMFKDYGLLRHDRLSVIIGNHDIFGGLQKADDIFNFPQKCLNTDYEKKVDEFVSYFSETFDNCIHKDEEKHFPFVKLFDNVLITGLNSNAPYSRISNPFASNGEIGNEQFSELTNILCTFGPLVQNRIVLIHHYFNKVKTDKKLKSGSIWQNIEKQTMKLRKKKRLIHLFKRYNVDLVLHGHLHESREYNRKGIRFLNGGATIINSKPETFMINFIDINTERIKTEIHCLHSNSSEIIFSGNNTVLDNMKPLTLEPNPAY